MLQCPKNTAPQHACRLRYRRRDPNKIMKSKEGVCCRREAGRTRLGRGRSWPCNKAPATATHPRNRARAARAPSGRSRSQSLSPEQAPKAPPGQYLLQRVWTGRLQCGDLVHCRGPREAGSLVHTCATTRPTPWAEFQSRPPQVRWALRTPSNGSFQQHRERRSPKTATGLYRGARTLRSRPRSDSRLR